LGPQACGQQIKFSAGSLPSGFKDSTERGAGGEGDAKLRRGFVDKGEADSVGQAAHPAGADVSAIEDGDHAEIATLAPVLGTGAHLS
jgi:hypothetical protein